MLSQIFLAATVLVPFILAAENATTITSATTAAAKAKSSANTADLLSNGCDANGVVCHGLPGGCLKSADSPCEVLHKITEKGELLHIEQTALANHTNLHLNFTNRWIGLGFSNSGKMPDSAVVHCFRDENGTAQAKLTYNVPIVHLNIGWSSVDQTPLEVVSASATGDRLNCVVNLHKNFTIQTSHFDLSQKHYLLAATGPLLHGNITRHDRKPARSEADHAF